MVRERSESPESELPQRASELSRALGTPKVGDWGEDTVVRPGGCSGRETPGEVGEASEKGLTGGHERGWSQWESGG